MIEIIQREFIYLWYYFEIQFRQIFWYWILGMAIGSLISVFAKDRKLGILGIIPACLLGIASPLCMYGTIPIAASFARQGMREDWLAAFMMASILLNPQLIIYSAALATDIVKSEATGDSDATTYNGWNTAVYTPTAASAST